MRPPRPRLIARSRSPPLDKEDNEEDTEGYDTCEENCRGDATAALVAAAQPVIEFLQETDEGAAKIVLALCCRLQKREELVGRLRIGVQNAKTKCDRATRKAQAQAQAQENCQGQSARHWWQVQKLTRKVDRAMQLNYRLLNLHHRLVP